MLNKFPRPVRYILTVAIIMGLVIGLRQGLLAIFPEPMLKVSPPRTQPPTPPASGTRGIREDSPFTIMDNAVGNKLEGDYHFTDQDGKPFNLAGWYDKPFVTAFIFASCEDVCPAINTSLKRIVRKIGFDRLGEDFRILMVSFDTKKDDPEFLKKFGANFTDDFTNWRFVTGDPSEIKRLADTLGVVYKRDDKGAWLHTVGVTIVANGQVYKQVIGPAYRISQIMSPVLKAQGKKYVPLVGKSEKTIN